MINILYFSRINSGQSTLHSLVSKVTFIIGFGTACFKLYRSISLFGGNK